jgi:hypothetical protein
MSTSSSTSSSLYQVMADKAKTVWPQSMVVEFDRVYNDTGKFVEQEYESCLKLSVSTNLSQHQRQSIRNMMRDIMDNQLKHAAERAAGWAFRNWCENTSVSLEQGERIWQPEDIFKYLSGDSARLILEDFPLFKWDENLEGSTSSYNNQSSESYGWSWVDQVVALSNEVVIRIQSGTHQPDANRYQTNKVTWFYTV